MSSSSSSPSSYGSGGGCGGDDDDDDDDDDDYAHQGKSPQEQIICAQAHYKRDAASIQTHSGSPPGQAHMPHVWA
eukprot:6228077-Karenia_brevis.AAC.1